MTRGLLRPLQILWLLLLAFVLYLLAERTMVMPVHAHAVCMPPHCQFGQVDPGEARVLRSLGLPINLYDYYDDALRILFEMSFIVVAALLIWRKPSDRMALVSAFALLLFGGISASADPKIPPMVPEPLSFLGNVLAGLGQAGFFALFYLFPAGRLVRRWLLVPLAAGLILQTLPSSPPPHGPLADLVGLIGLAIIAAPFAIIIYVQIYKYRRTSTPAQRQQTKWIVFGTAVAIIGFLLTAALTNLPIVAGNLPLQMLADVGLYGFFMLIPLSMGFAILRYRLYDVDLLINRTLVYGALTISTVAVYVAAVVGLQALFRALTGQHSDLAIAIATLAVAALFNPWRHRLQSFIDRQFYRRKYDAARALSAFNGRLRDEVDLDQLAGDMIGVLQDTLQPASASLWLRDVSKTEGRA
ncbi:MAG TPA: hypothetical protein VFB58_00760 [Chloroflexota bacterium]|nr:hypothetical protein [Chloroflexota bacterium]